MYIIVVGGSEIGYYLTKALLSEGHEVLLVEKNAATCEAITDELGSICIHGDGCETATLTEAGTDRAGILIAVTGDDEDNLVSCQVAKHKFGVRRTIARIKNPKNEAIFKKLGIDVTISSTNIILEHIEEEVPTHPLTHLLAIEDAGLEIVEVKIPPESNTVGISVRQLSLPQENKLVVIIRADGRTLVPTLNTVLQAEDRILAVTTPESEEALRTALRGT